jgi:hypothetical protein
MLKDDGDGGVTLAPDWADEVLAKSCVTRVEATAASGGEA